MQETQDFQADTLPDEGGKAVALREGDAPDAQVPSFGGRGVHSKADAQGSMNEPMEKKCVICGDPIPDRNLAHFPQRSNRKTCGKHTIEEYKAWWSRSRRQKCECGEPKSATAKRCRSCSRKPGMLGGDYDTTPCATCRKPIINYKSSTARTHCEECRRAGKVMCSKCGENPVAAGRVKFCDRCAVIVKRARFRSWQQAHGRRYRSNNRHHLLHYCRTYRKDNRERLLARARVRWHNNSGNIREHRMAWQRANREKIRGYVRISKARSKQTSNLFQIIGVSIALNQNPQNENEPVNS